jgi:hypothetical protein
LKSLLEAFCSSAGTLGLEPGFFLDWGVGCWGYLYFSFMNSSLTCLMSTPSSISSANLGQPSSGYS